MSSVHSWSRVAIRVQEGPYLSLMTWNKCPRGLIIYHFSWARVEGKVIYALPVCCSSTEEDQRCTYDMYCCFTHCLCLLWASQGDYQTQCMRGSRAVPTQCGYWGCSVDPFSQFREYVSTPGAPGKVFPRFGVAPRVGVNDSHSSVWPLEWSVMHLSGILDFKVGGHDGAHKGRVHVIVPFVGRKNGNLIDHQQSYNVLVLVLGLEEAVMFGGKAL